MKLKKDYMVEVNKKPRETTSALLRRFTQKVRENKILINAKKSRFKEKNISRNVRRIEALEREKRRKEKTRLKKLGKYEPKGRH